MKKVATIGLVFAVAVVVYLGLTLGDRQPDPVAAETALDDKAKDQLANEAASSRIAAESKILDAHNDPAVEAVEPVLQATAPPGFVPAPVVREATPPEGYSFAGFHEVARGAMTAEDFDRDEPPAEPPGWMTFGDNALAELAAASGRDWSFGWVKLAEGADLESTRRLLAANGGEVLGRAGDLVRARLPGDASSLQAIANSRWVAGLGAVPADRKVTDTLTERAATNLHEEVPVWITLMSDDPDGRWRLALKQFGAEVGRFDPSVRTYAATIPLTALAPISAADFVLAVESIGRVERTLEVAAPSMGADSVRDYDESLELFVGTGGASVPVGVMDDGFNVDHLDLSSNRRSICGLNFTDLFDPREEDQDLWFDAGQHGSHVAGIVFGSGADQRVRAGMAPLVQDIRIAKVISSRGSASALGWNRAMDWFAKPTACGDGVPRKALVINASLGVPSDAWEGRSVVERKIDASVWAARQLFVTSAGNARDRALSSMAGAKNALSVGAAQNIGDIAAFSSQGPTNDGRLMPKIVGTGVTVASARGRGARDGYNTFSGTSMSSPAVAGVAALVMDAVPEMREEPAALRARLMASAVKPDAFLGHAAAFPLDNTNGPGTINNVYGLGKVSARTAVLTRDDDDGWNGGSAAFDIDQTGHAYRDIVVPEGASRLDVVMTWDDPPADTITNAVLHDLDLWVDRGVSCGDIAACGHYNSRSRIDNVEWVIVPNPPAGVYRLKVLPNRIYGPAPRAGLAWTVIRGDSSPKLHVAVEDDRVEVAPSEAFDVEVSITSDSYVAAGANLRVDCRTEGGSTACDKLAYSRDGSELAREDGLGRTLVRDGVSIVVGEIGPDEEQTVSLSFSGQPEGSFLLHLTASGWNAEGGEASVAVVVGESDTPAPVRRPPNDDFAMAMELDSAGGETAFDIVAATPDAGEPAYALAMGHPQRERSLWYVWTAPETGLARFTVGRSTPGDHSDYVVVDVYRDGSIANLEAVGGGQLGGGSTFFAEQGETYRIRLGIQSQFVAERLSAIPELTLGWGPGSRPENDNYAMAGVLEGSAGTMAGSNQGATTEPAEYMGHSNPLSPQPTSGWSSSVWYRWTAPSTGDYQFSVNRESQMVAAFEGDSLSGTRMVSGRPAQGLIEGIVFPATEGVEYRIGVATGSAYWASTEFELSWAPGEREEPGNDDFANASAVFGDSWFGPIALEHMTVEHGEPAESGVRTSWWHWSPATDGRYTWLAQILSRGLNDEVPEQIAVFAGDDLSALEVVAFDEGTTLERRMAFDANADTAYWFSIGLPRDAAQTSTQVENLVMVWGPTPHNDDYANAAALVGMSGSVSGSTEFATNEPGEISGSMGDSSLWWTFEPDESGWVRFDIDGPYSTKLAIYLVGVDGEKDLVRISSHIERPTATFKVEAGHRYVIRVSSYVYDAQGYSGAYRSGFTLSWNPTDPPALLRYVDAVALDAGQLVDDGSTTVGEGTSLEDLVDGVFNGDGTELYMASPKGILVFERDLVTGELNLESAADHPVSAGGDARMIWDGTDSALLLASCDGWLKFTAVEGGGIEPAGSVDGAPCPTGDVLLHGDFVHHVMSPYLIETFKFDEGHDALSAAGVIMIPDIASAAMTADGENVYALTTDIHGQHTLLAVDRDPESGSLAISTIIRNGSPTGADGQASVEGLENVDAVAVHGSHLFVSTRLRETLAFDLVDRASPAFLRVVPNFTQGYIGDSTCRPRARHDVAAVDAICGAENFTVQAGGDGSVYGSDLLQGFDSFGNVVPDMEYLGFVRASPDGRHLYAFYRSFFFRFDPDGLTFGYSYALAVFERVYGD